MIFPGVTVIIEPGILEVALARESSAPETNFAPVTLTVVDPIVNPDKGDILEIVGTGLVIVNAYGFVTDDPSVFFTVRL